MNDSNYPPGVSGSEWQIAGPDEAALYRYCDNLAQWLPSYQVRLMADDYLRLARRAAEGARTDLGRWQRQWVTALEDHIIEAPCGWSGIADLSVVDYIGQWTCPRCGVEHEDVIDPDLFGDQS